MDKSAARNIVLEDLKPSDLPLAWRKRVKAKAEERLTVTIQKHTVSEKPAPVTKARPNATFGMWADRDQLVPSIYARSLRKPRNPR